MGSVEYVLEYSKKIETILTNNFHARGNGLGEKFRSLESILSFEAIERLRRINRIRNKAAHELDFVLHDPEKFRIDCELVIEELHDIEQLPVETSPSRQYNPSNHFYETKQNILKGYLIFIKDDGLRIVCFLIGLSFWISIGFMAMKGIIWYKAYLNILSIFWSPSNDLVLNIITNASIVVFCGILLYCVVLGLIFLAIVSLYLILVGIILLLLLWIASLSNFGLIISGIILIVLISLAISKFIQSDFLKTMKKLFTRKMSKG